MWRRKKYRWFGWKINWEVYINGFHYLPHAKNQQRKVGKGAKDLIKEREPVPNKEEILSQEKETTIDRARTD